MCEADMVGFCDEWLDYCHMTGVISWRKNRMGGVLAGDTIGTNAQGYSAIQINSKAYLGHRLAYIICNKKWPNGYIDHINGVRDDNRMSNLRVCTNIQNSYNRGPNRNNTTGYKGVSYYKGSGKYMAQIQYNGIKLHLGLFTSKEKAAVAYNNAADVYHDGFGYKNKIKHPLGIEEMKSNAMFK